LRLTQQTASGLFFLLFGAVYLWLAQDLTMGTAADMGVGYTPRMLAVGSMLIGVTLLGGGLLGRGNREAVTIAPKPLLLTTLMVGAFALLLPWLGLPLTVIACVLPAALSGEKFNIGILSLVALALAVFTTLLFAWALKLQIPIWPAIPGVAFPRLA
jgi:Tripartite tricarboxylate transporter TctB family